VDVHVNDAIANNFWKRPDAALLHHLQLLVG
jgi:hypothetical protein